MPTCSICNKEVNFKNIIYIYQNIFICKECFPQYYVKNLCKAVERRLRGESPTACNFCMYKKQCDAYISKTLKYLTSSHS